MEQTDRLKWIISSRDKEELTEKYDNWAKDYDAELQRDFQYVGPQRTAEFLARYVPVAAKILDAGAGTGLVGEILAKMGYQNLVAMDLSEGMLAEARKKNVYREFHRMAMGEPLDFATDSFDAVVSTGVLTVAHAPASSLDELIRVTRPGGYIAFTLRPDVYAGCGFKEKQAALEAEGKWKLAEVSERFQALPKGESDLYHYVYVYQVTC
ncbi:class I SAM-dependent DNA methyltransferase [Chloroflexota bacterium]